jgi:hypothetical protein
MGRRFHLRLLEVLRRGPEHIGGPKLRIYELLAGYVFSLFRLSTSLSARVMGTIFILL